MGGMCSAQVSSAPLYATGEATEPAREMQADEEVGAMAAARVGDAASPPPPDGEAASPPQPDNEEYQDDFEFLMYATPGARLTRTRETDDAPEPPPVAANEAAPRATGDGKPPDQPHTPAPPLDEMEPPPRRAIEEARELDRANQDDDARADEAAPDAPAPAPPDDEAAAPPEPEQAARVESSIKSIFDKERGCGAMLVMEGGVIDQATTDTAAEAAATAEYRPGDAVEYGRRSLVIEEILGNGAFGEVYKAKPSDGGAALALKSVKPSRLKPETFRDAQVQLAEESAICFVIGLHPHIVSVHCVLTTPKGLLIALDLVEGADLRKLAGVNFNGTLYQGGRAKANERVDALVAQIYKGLAHLHERCVLHQDIKPEVGARLSRRADLGGRSGA